MDISKISWGNDSAELDENLTQYFVPSQQYEMLNKWQKNIVLGRKGTGKSACRKKLSSELRANCKNVVIEVLPRKEIFLAAKTNNSEFLKESSEIFFENVWYEYLTKMAFKTIGSIQEGKCITGSLERARSFAIEKGVSNLDFIERLKSLLSQLKIKSDLIGGASLDIITELKSLQELDAFEYHLSKILEDDIDVIFLIDDLDVGWDNSDISNKLLHGLLLAVVRLREINIKLRNVTFLRNDIYKQIMNITQHSDKFRDVVQLKWDYASLMKLLSKRIRFNFEEVDFMLENENETFLRVFPEKNGIKYTSDWMMERTLSRPRELIQFSKLYTENLSTNAQSIETLKKAEIQYSDWKLQDLYNEYMHVFPGLKIFFATWKSRHKRKRYAMPGDEFSEFILEVLEDSPILPEDGKFIYDIKMEANFMKLQECLYEIGFIGDVIIGGDGGTKIIYSIGNDEHRPKFEKIQIHPCFRKAVDTVERIRSKRNDGQISTDEDSIGDDDE